MDILFISKARSLVLFFRYQCLQNQHVEQVCEMVLMVQVTLIRVYLVFCVQNPF